MSQSTAKTTIRPYALYKAGGFDIFSTMGIETLTISTVKHYCNICDTFLRRRAQGFSYTRAVDLTSEEMCASDRTVRRAIETML